MKEYKIITVDDDMSLDDLEKLLNELGQEGWEVKTASKKFISNYNPAVGGINIDVPFLILEKDNEYA